MSLRCLGARRGVNIEANLAMMGNESATEEEIYGLILVLSTSASSSKPPVKPSHFELGKKSCPHPATPFSSYLTNLKINTHTYLNS